jgi:flagellum-specific peptidoglycan hydrolase FlgJ
MDLRPLLALLGAAGVLYYMENKAPAAGAPPAPEGKAAFVAELSGIVSALVGPLGWSEAIVAVIVAWAAMESSWGTSKLAVQGFNLFGIKAGPTWKAEGKPFDTYVTHEHQGQPGYPPEGETITATFRHYPSWTASVQDFINLLKITHTPPFRPVYDAFARGDVQGAMQAADASGYSTASKYSKRIIDDLETIAGIA